MVTKPWILWNRTNAGLSTMKAVKQERKPLRSVLGYPISAGTTRLVSMAITLVHQVLWQRGFTGAVSKATATVKSVEVTLMLFTTFQVISKNTRDLMLESNSHNTRP